MVPEMLEFIQSCMGKILGRYCLVAEINSEAAFLLSDSGAFVTKPGEFLFLSLLLNKADVSFTLFYRLT